MNSVFLECWLRKRCKFYGVLLNLCQLRKFTWRSTNCPPKTYISSFSVAAHDATTLTFSPLAHWYGPYVKSISAFSSPKICINGDIHRWYRLNTQILLTVESRNYWNIVWSISAQQKHCAFFSRRWKSYWEAKSKKLIC